MVQLRKMEKRETDDGRLYLEGYFARYNEPYEVCTGWVETISPGAFSRVLAEGGDTKALWNHNHDIVLGSTAAGTLKLFEDSEGLRGSVEINQNDTDAMNAYARIQRGDVSGCSFGFDCTWDDFMDADGVYRTVLREITKLYEVSPCTFPAYESTSIGVRERLTDLKNAVEQRENAKKDEWKSKMRGLLRNGN